MDTGAQNAVVGDAFGTDLPQVQTDQQELMEEKKAARFSKTAEFKKLKEYLNGRIEFYQTYLPDGRTLTSVDTEERGNQWTVATAVISELKAIIVSYERAQHVVDEASKRA